MTPFDWDLKKFYSSLVLPLIVYALTFFTLPHAASLIMASCGSTTDPLLLRALFYPVIAVVVALVAGIIYATVWLMSALETVRQDFYVVGRVLRNNE